MAFGDLDGDWNVDLITCPAYPNTYAVFLWNGDGSFRPASTPFGSLNIDTESQAITLADRNGDGKLDLAIGLAWRATATARSNGPSRLGLTCSTRAMRR